MLEKQRSGLVLIADDNPGVRTVFRRMLERSGLRVLEAANGREALTVASQADIDLAIIDLVMPEKDGLETIRELLALRPGLKIVVVSATAVEHHRMLASLLGAAAVLSKPVPEGELTACVTKLLDHQH